MPRLPPIPFIDIRDGTPVDLLRRYPDRARALARASIETFGMASRLVCAAGFPFSDRISRAWLLRTDNPYRDEIDAFGKLLGIGGITTLNICFEWGCTSGVFRSPDGMLLRRVLDWRFPSLGEHLVVAYQSGTAGDFYNITWPAMSGVYHGLAAERFSAAIHQAPMRRHGGGFVFDWTKNRIAVNNNRGMPPAHLLRRVFETAPDYASAKAMLCREAVALPVIFILAGTGHDEGCVIERIERDFAVRELERDRVCTANHFESWLKDTARDWMPRSGDSPERLRCALDLAFSSTDSDFAWFKPPIANPTSRVVLNANAATGELALMGVRGSDPVTAVFNLPRAA